MTQDAGEKQHGSCFCGLVQFTVSGSPVAMGYCHCESCRSWSASPINAFTLWPPEALTVTSGEHLVVTYSKTPRSFRSWCSNCGGHVFARHPEIGVVCIYAAAIPGLAFEPTVHLHYAEARMGIRDGLPKLRDFPRQFGGSGITVAE